MLTKSIEKKRNLIPITDEEWRMVPKSDDRYEVSSYGRIKSYCNDKVNGQVLKQIDVKGFLSVRLTIEGKRKTYYTHKITAELFVEKTSPLQEVVTHIDSKIKNNYYKNLKWQTKAEHYETIMKRLKTINIGRKGRVTNSNLKEEDVAVLKSMLKKGVTQSYVAKMFCISEMQVTRIKRGENWGHVKPLKD